MLFNREKTETVWIPRHATLVTARLRFLFLAAQVWRHAGAGHLPAPDEPVAGDCKWRARIRARGADCKRVTPAKHPQSVNNSIVTTLLFTKDNQRKTPVSLLHHGPNQPWHNNEHGEQESRK